MPTDNLYSEQLISLLKREMQRVDNNTHKRLEDYNRNTLDAKEKHAHLLKSVQGNLTKFKDDYDNIKQKFRLVSETSRNLKSELAQSLNERNGLQAKYDELLQNYEKIKNENKQKKSIEKNTVTTKKRKIEQSESDDEDKDNSLW